MFMSNDSRLALKRLIMIITVDNELNFEFENPALSFT